MARPGELGRRLVPVLAAEQRGRRPDAERPQLQDRGDALPHHRLEQVIGRGRFGPSRRDDHHHAYSLQPTGQIAQEPQRRSVRPVGIIDQRDYRTTLGEVEREPVEPMHRLLKANLSQRPASRAGAKHLCGQTRRSAQQAPPSVTNVSPSSGPAAGGTVVTITGTGFTGADAVDFGTASATNMTVNSATQITATSPAGTAGDTVDVTVIEPGGTSATSCADVLLRRRAAAAGDPHGHDRRHRTRNRDGLRDLVPGHVHGYLHPGNERDPERRDRSASRFGGWSGACTGTGACTITMSSAESVAATFTNILTAFVANAGAITVSPIDVATGKACTPIGAGSGPTAIALTPTGTTAYVVDKKGGTVTRSTSPATPPRARSASGRVPRRSRSRQTGVPPT